MKFVENAEDDCTRIVDGLLDVLTKGQHTITMKQIEQVTLLAASIEELYKDSTTVIHQKNELKIYILWGF